MNLVRRILRNGLLAAVILAAVGFGFAELASLWMTSQAGRGAVGEAATAQSLRYRLPLGMAGWGFAFVVLTEVGLNFWRRRRPQPAAEQPAPAAAPVPAAVLIEEILRQAEAERQSPSPPRPTGSPSHQ